MQPKPDTQNRKPGAARPRLGSGLLAHPPTAVIRAASVASSSNHKGTAGVVSSSNNHQGAAGVASFNICQGAASVASSSNHQGMVGVVSSIDSHQGAASVASSKPPGNGWGSCFQQQSPRSCQWGFFQQSQWNCRCSFFQPPPPRSRTVSHNWNAISSWSCSHN